jgi:hypothetical protein
MMSTTSFLSASCVILSVFAFAGEKTVTITTIPAGATVEVEGHVSCSSTPCSVSFPDYYFRKHFTFWSQRLTHPVQLVIRKQGYLPKAVTVTEGPKRWQAWNTPDYFDYFNITQREFPVVLDLVPAKLTPGLAPGNTKTVDAQDTFVWFDESVPEAGTQFIEVVITARAYDAVLNILRNARGPNTAVRYGQSVLETNYHPLTFRLGDWLQEQPEPTTIPSVFYWEDETLSDTTPVMNFYMTRRAYEKTLEILGQHFAPSPAIQPEQNSPPGGQRSGFWSSVARAAQGALQGMANYYAYVRPVEQQQIANQRAMSAETAALNTQVFELQKLNNTLSQMQTQAFLRELQRQSSEYSRMLSRYANGRWPQ